jgi:hypothetical protein
MRGSSSEGIFDLTTEVVNGDSAFILGCLLVRLLSPLDHQTQDLMMSVLRVLSGNPDLARDPAIPKVQQKTSGGLINIPNNTKKTKKKKKKRKRKRNKHFFPHHFQ